ncbi:hypothetical protein [Rickettsia endosymbiont of Urophora cardui]|uniref:hypothetical protein n=1 Tax=Rickettsia endosymbiont of Urophora cardui TaxID=3066265 RepID=UPI00313E10B2
MTIFYHFLTDCCITSCLKTILSIRLVEFWRTDYQAWRVKNNYGRRERVENTFFRFKTSFGSKFLSRHDQNMTKEMSIKCHLLNKMFEIGKPISVPVG